MELRHLRYFIAVAEEQHFGRAANRLHIVQSALSMQIKALEAELGGPLLTRTTRRVTLTEAGRIFLIEARRLVAQADHAIGLVRSSLAGETGRVRIGFVGNAVLSGVMLEDLRRFHRNYPNAEIVLSEATPSVLRGALIADELDLAYVSHGSGEYEALQEIPLLSGPLMAVMAEDHPLAIEPHLTTTALMSERLLLYGLSDPGRLHGWETQGYMPSRVLHLTSTLGVLAAAAAGLGVALGPAQLERLCVPGLAYRVVTDLQEVTLSLVHRAGETGGAVLAFLASVQGQVPPSGAVTVNVL
jgi:DNA-binding transcriptional LysR family regulator